MGQTDLERLLDELFRPLFVWRMARAQLTSFTASRSLKRSAMTRRERALQEIQRVLTAHGLMFGSSQLWMGFTARGEMCHVTRDGVTSLCGRTIDRLVRRFGSETPVPFAEHWTNESLISDHIVCASCSTIVTRDR